MLDYKIFFLGFIPEWFFASFLGLAIFGIRLEWPKYIKLTLIISVMSYLSKSLMVNYKLGGFQILAYLVILILAYKYYLSLSWRVSLASALAIFILLFSGKFLLIERVLEIFKVQYSNLAANPMLEVAVSNIIDLPIYVFGIITFFTKFRIADFSWAYNKSEYKIIKEVDNQVLNTINIILVNFLLTLILIMYHYFWSKKFGYVRIMSVPEKNILFSIFGMVILSGIITLIFNAAFKLKKLNKMKKEEATTFGNEQKARFLRAERKEFSRQLGLIQGLIKEGETEKLTRYLTQVSYEVTTVGNLSILDKPELKALLLQKASQARKHNISVQYNVNSTLNHLEVTSADLVSLIGNLFDNAIEALAKTKCSPKEILLNVFEANNKIMFEVYNNQPIIPLKMQKKIFTKGVSTKGKDGRGYGLTIVSAIVNKYRGHLSLRSLPGKGTIFSIDFPAI